MSGFYELSVQDDHVVISSSEPVSPEAARAFFGSAPQRVRAAGRDKVLIDIRPLTDALSTTDRYFYAVEFAEAFRGLKVAVVQSEAMYDPRRFGETVAANRGLDSRNFTSLDEARSWLLSDARQDAGEREA